MHLVIIQGSIELPHKDLIFLTEGRQLEVPGEWRIDYPIKLSLWRLWPWLWVRSAMACIATAALTLRR
jgi:hypothetical protein